jgi:carbonic anhydrase/acetyltransferase-like protein (isoleucine patch superfamily)
MRTRCSRYNHWMLRPYRGRLPLVDPSAYVDDSAQVIGDVTLGAESSVWMNVVIRGDVNIIRIGARSNVQDGTVVHVMNETHPTRIGDDVTIGHGALIHGCTIRDRVLIGMGAIVLNGAVIGEDSIVAAGTLVTEGTVIPPRSMVMGSPGKVRRPLSDADVASILVYSRNYVGYRLDYMVRG